MWKRGRVFEDEVFTENTCLGIGCKKRGTKFKWGRSFKHWSRGFPGQWFTETGYLRTSAIFVSGTSGIPPILNYRSVCPIYSLFHRNFIEPFMFHFEGSVPSCVWTNILVQLTVVGDHRRLFQYFVLHQLLPLDLFFSFCILSSTDSHQRWPKVSHWSFSDCKSPGLLLFRPILTMQDFG